MEYEVEFRPEADRDLSALDRDVTRRVLSRIRWLAQHFDEITVESLSGRQWKDLFKFRAGDYRILYTVNRAKKLISIHLIGHRREIYDE